MDTEENGFVVSGTLVRCEGTLLHDFCYASPAGAFTVYAERLRPQTGFRLQYRKTGIIGLEYPVDGNERTLFGAFGSLKARGTDSPKRNVTLNSNWLNIDGQVGYVICRSRAHENTMVYHDRNQIDPRRPHLQESIALISDDSARHFYENEWSCVVTFLNLAADETQSMANQVQLTGEDHSVTIRVRDEVFHVAFDAESISP